MIRLFDDFFYPFFGWGVCVCKSLSQYSVAAVKNYQNSENKFWDRLTPCLTPLPPILLSGNTDFEQHKCFIKARDFRSAAHGSQFKRGPKIQCFCLYLVCCPLLANEVCNNIQTFDFHPKPTNQRMLLPKDLVFEDRSVSSL